MQLNRLNLSKAYQINQNCNSTKHWITFMPLKLNCMLMIKRFFIMLLKTNLTRLRRRLRSRFKDATRSQQSFVVLMSSTKLLFYTSIKCLLTRPTDLIFLKLSSGLKHALFLKRSMNIKMSSQNALNKVLVNKFKTCS